MRSSCAITFCTVCVSLLGLQISSVPAAQEAVVQKQEEVDPIGRALESARRFYKSDIQKAKEECVAKLESEFASLARNGDVDGVKRLLESKNGFLENKIGVDRIALLKSADKDSYTREFEIARSKFLDALDLAKKSYLAAKNVTAAEAVISEEFVVREWAPIKDGMPLGESTIIKAAVWSVRLKKGERLSIQADSPFRRVIHLHVIDKNMDIISLMPNCKDGKPLKESVRFTSTPAKEDTILHVCPHGKKAWEGALPWVALSEMTVEKSNNDSTKLTWRFKDETDDAVTATVRIK